MEASETGGGGHGCCKHLPCTSPGSGEDRVEVHLVHTVVHLSHVSAAQHEAHGAAVAAGGAGLPSLLRDLEHDGVPAHTLHPALVHHLLVHGQQQSTVPRPAGMGNGRTGECAYVMRVFITCSI